MYPNPQDVLPLPPRPDVHHYRKRAKDLVRACRSGDPTAVRTWAAHWIDDLTALHPGGRPDNRDAERRADQVAAFARERLGDQCALNQAQFVIARAHGFDSWPRLVGHLEQLAGERTPVSAFEEAADAIIDGDIATLDRLLEEHPDLVRARSSREHRATLLHYVSANGVENFRQRTPSNIVDIAKRLLDAGADVDAEADVYGGGATTLGLTVTSAHPRAAGVQIELADLLLGRGARMDDRIVDGCLANGCPEAAAHLVRLGAKCGFSDAAGIGRLDLMRIRFSGDARPSARELATALMMAAWYGRTAVVEFLLDNGVDPGTRAIGDRDGSTALHIAAYQGDVALVELLLRRGAPVDVIDDAYGTPPLIWAMHAWLVENRTPDEPYRTTLRLLAEAGCTVEARWIEDERVRADPEVHAALLRRVRDA